MVASTIKTNKVTLITFDVDGTLIHSTTTSESASHARAFSYGVGSIYSKDPIEVFSEKYPNPPSAMKMENYHGSTDGLIALHYAKNACGTPAAEGFPLLDQVFDKMYEYVQDLSDEDMIKGIEALPGVIETLTSLSSRKNMGTDIMCGLVTGNVEGIAIKKMRATGILATGVFSKSCITQKKWAGNEADSFLGGFGSDYCSGDIDDLSRVYKDRGEQIVIAYNRAKSMLTEDQEIVRVVHVGDAPGDVLAAKYCAEEKKFGDNVTVGCIAVATGKYSSEKLESLFGTFDKGSWEPFVLEKGIADPSFIDLCGVNQN